MYGKNILTSSDNKNYLLDMIKVRNLTTKNDLKQYESHNKHKYQSQELNKISLNSLKNSIHNPNIASLKSNNLTEIHLLKYRPKRLIKLKEQGKSKIPFSKIGAFSIDMEKTYSTDEKRNTLKKNTSQNVYDITDNEKLMNSNNDTEFKSKYIFKFTKNSEEFNKLSYYKDLLSDNNDKRKFEETLSKLSKLIENQNNFLFNNIDSNTNNIINNTNYTNNNISVINNYEISPQKINFLNTITKNPVRNKSNTDITNFFTYTSNNITSNNNSINSVITSTKYSSSNNNLNIKKLIIFWSDFIVLITKFISKILNEFNLCKKENEKLKKKSYKDELKLNNKINEVDDLKKLLNRFDINMKINHQIQKDLEIKKKKKDFKKKENVYLLSIFQLEEDIRNLTLLLDKNKFYYDEYKNISKEIDINKRQKELLKIKFNKELQDTNVKISIEKDNQEELKIKIEKLNEYINEMKLEKEKIKTVNIELQAKIKKLEMIINERNENIRMLNEELEWYIRKLNIEKFNFNNFKNELNILEKKIQNLEEEKQKEEQRKKKENLDDSNNNNLSPIPNNKNGDIYASPSPTDFSQNINS